MPQEINPAPSTANDKVLTAFKKLQLMFFNCLKDDDDDGMVDPNDIVQLMSMMEGYIWGQLSKSLQNREFTQEHFKYHAGAMREIGIAILGKDNINDIPIHYPGPTRNRKDNLIITPYGRGNIVKSERPKDSVRELHESSDKGSS